MVETAVLTVALGVSAGRDFPHRSNVLTDDCTASMTHSRARIRR